jgi:hypothetical protein
MVVNNNVTVLVAVTEATPEDTLAPPAAAGIAAAALNIKKDSTTRPALPFPPLQNLILRHHSYTH